MKKFILMISVAIAFIFSPQSIAAPPSGPHGGGHGMGRPPMHAGVSMGHRPPMARPPMHHHVGMHPPMHHHPVYRPIRPVPVYRPYFYSSVYYPTRRFYSTYTYYPETVYSYETVTPVTTGVNTVVVRDDYAGINTAANVINAAANMATAIRFLTW